MTTRLEEIRQALFKADDEGRTEDARVLAEAYFAERAKEIAPLSVLQGEQLTLEQIKQRQAQAAKEGIAFREQQDISATELAGQAAKTGFAGLGSAAYAAGAGAVSEAFRNPGAPMGVPGGLMNAYVDALPQYVQDAREGIAQYFQEESAQAIQSAIETKVPEAIKLEQMKQQRGEGFATDLIAGAGRNVSNVLPLLGAGVTYGVTKSPTAAVLAQRGLATLPAAQAYADAYISFKQKYPEATEEEAQNYAKTQAGLEYAFEAAGVGPATSVLGTIAKKAGWEALSEGGTSAAQQIAQRVQAPELAPQTAGEAAYDVALSSTLGGLMGGPAAIPGSVEATRAERIKRAPPVAPPTPTGDPAIDAGQAAGEAIARSVADSLSLGTAKQSSLEFPEAEPTIKDLFTGEETPAPGNMAETLQAQQVSTLQADLANTEAQRRAVQEKLSEKMTRKERAALTKEATDLIAKENRIKQDLSYFLPRSEAPATALTDEQKKQAEIDAAFIRREVDTIAQKEAEQDYTQTKAQLERLYNDPRVQANQMSLALVSGKLDDLRRKGPPQNVEGKVAQPTIQDTLPLAEPQQIESTIVPAQQPQPAGLTTTLPLDLRTTEQRKKDQAKEVSAEVSKTKSDLATANKVLTNARQQVTDSVQRGDDFSDPEGHAQLVDAAANAEATVRALSYKLSTLPTKAGATSAKPTRAQKAPSPVVQQPTQTTTTDNQPDIADAERVFAANDPVRQALESKIAALANGTTRTDRVALENEVRANLVTQQAEAPNDKRSAVRNAVLNLARKVDNAPAMLNVVKTIVNIQSKTKDKIADIPDGVDRIIASLESHPMLQGTKVIVGDDMNTLPPILADHIKKDGGEIAGSYLPSSDIIMLTGNIGTGMKKDLGGDIITIIHEMLHGVSERAFILHDKGLLTDKELIDAIDHFDKVREAFNRRFNMGQTEHGHSTRKLLTTGESAAVDYANKNRSEFLAVALTSPEFRSAARKMNMLTKVKDAIRKLFRLPPTDQQILDDILDAGLKIVDLTRKGSETIQNDFNALKAQVNGGTAQGTTSTTGLDGVIDVDGVQRPTTDSGGKLIHSTVDGIKNFWKWFAGSAVVDSNGNPLVMYHGTSQSEGGDAFTMFDSYGSNYGLFGAGSYFTDDPSVASEYTTKGRGDTPSVYPVYISIKNPIDMDAPADPAKWKAAYPKLDIESYHEGGDTNESYYRAVEGALRDEGYEKWEGSEVIQDGLRRMGHDGITHIGGGRVKSEGKRHRVFIAFDPEQVKSAIGNSGDFSPLEARITANRLPSTPTRSERVKLREQTVGKAKKVEPGTNALTQSDFYKTSKDFLSALFSPFGREGAEGKRAMQIAKGTQLEIDAVTKRLSNALKNELYHTKATDKELAVIDQLAKTYLSGYKAEDRKAAINDPRLPAKLKPVLESARKEMDDLSVRVAAQITDAYAGKDMPESVIDTLETLTENLGKYISRSYEIDYVKGFGKKLWRDYKAGEAKAIERLQPLMNLISNQVATLPDSLNKLGRTDKGNLVWKEKGRGRETVRDYLSRMHTNLIGSPAGLSNNDMFEALNALAKSPKMKNIQEMTDTIVKSVIDYHDVDNDSQVKFFRGLRSDDRALRKRVRVPEEFRKAWGEVDDPAINVVITLSRQAAALANLRASAYWEQASPDLFTDAQSDETPVRVPNDPFIYGRLAGKYTTKGVLATIKAQAAPDTAIKVLNTNNSEEFGRYLGGLIVKVFTEASRIGKTANIVLNLKNLAMNLTNFIYVPLANGNLTYAHMGKGAKVAKELFGTAYRMGELSPETRELLRVGVIDPVQTQVDEEVRQLKKESQLRRSLLANPLDVFSNQLNTLREANGFLELTPKIANYFWNKEQLARLYPSLTESEVQEEAARLTNETNFTYSYTPKAARMAETIGLSYVSSFKAETFRTTYANIAVGMRMLKKGDTPAIKLAGAQRLAGQALSFFLASYAVPTITKALHDALLVLGGNDGEDEDKVFNALEYVESGDQRVVWNLRPDGSFDVFDLGMWSTYDVAYSPARAVADAMEAAYEGDYDRSLEGLQDALKSSIGSFFDGAPLSKLVLRTIKGGDVETDAWLSTFIPGMVKSVGRSTDLPEDASLQEQVFAALNMPREERSFIEDLRGTTTGNFTRAVTESKDKLLSTLEGVPDGIRFIQSMSNAVLGERSAQYVPYKEEELIDLWGEVQDAQREAFEELMTKIEGARAINRMRGAPQDEGIQQALIDGGLSKKAAKQAVENGTYTPSPLSDSWGQREIDKAVRKETTRAAKAALRETLEKRRLQIIRITGGTVDDT